MKIIATVRDDWRATYLVEVTSDELATIKHGGPSASNRDGFKVGAEIKVGEHWKRVEGIENAQKRLDSAAQSIRAVADLLGTIDVVIPPELEKGGAK